jgi:translocation and assembly module TamB
MLGPSAVTAALEYSLELKGSDAYVHDFSMAGDGLDLKLSGSFVQALGDGRAAASDRKKSDADRASADKTSPDEGAEDDAREVGANAAANGEASVKLSLALAPGSGFARLASAALPALTPGAGIELEVDGGFVAGENELKDVSVAARTGDLSAFLPNLGGDADLALKASGRLSGDIAASLELRAERILFASGRGDPDPAELATPVLTASGTLADLADGPSFDGRVDLAAKGRLPGESEPKDATLSGAVAFSFNDTGKLFRAEGLALSALGADLKSSRISAALPAEGPPELSGSLELTVANWELPSKLAGRTITGEPLYLVLSLDGGSDPPRYAAAVRNGLLEIQGAARLSGTELSAVATGPLGSPAVELHLKEGPGQAAGFSWSQGEVAAKGAADGPTDVSLSFRAPGGGELASLSGAYNAPGALIRLDTLRIHYPGASQPVALSRPATLSAPPGWNSFDAPRLSLDRLELAIGRTTVTLAGAVRPADLRLEIREAPFSLAKEFGGPELPEGALTELNAHVGPGGAGGYDLKAFALLAGGDSDRKLRFAAEANGRLEGGRTMSGEINLALPGRPGGRGRRGQGAGPARRGAAGRAVPASGRAGGPAAVQASAGPGRTVPGAVTAADSADAAGPGTATDSADAAGPGTAADSADAAGAGTAAADTGAPEAGISDDPSRDAPDAAPVNVRYSFPFRQSGGFPVPDATGPVSAALKWTGRVESVWRLIGLDDRFLTGGVDLDARLRGTLGDMNLGGEIFIANGAYEDRALGISLTDVNLEGHVSDTSNDVSVLLEASDGANGTLALEGALRLDESPGLDVRGQLRHLAPLHRDDVSLTLSGLARIHGPFRALTISAKAMVESLEVDLNQRARGKSVRTLDIDTGEQKVSAGPRMDVSVDIPRSAYVRGRGLDSEWAGEIRLGGTTGGLLYSGNLRPVRGYFTFLGKDFTFSGGGVSFRNSRRFNPGLDIELTRTVPDLTAYLKVRGTLDRPQISFESMPPYPQDEVVSQVLFGKESSALSRLEALQLANSLMEMTGVGPRVTNPLVTMRDALGLSVLRIGEGTGGNDDRHLQGSGFRDNLDLDGDEDPAAAESASTLEAGKYLSDNIYVGVEQNLADNTTGVRVEVELTPNINLTGRTTSSSSRIALGWKKDY